MDSPPSTRISPVMLLLLSDTHRSTDHGLDGHRLSAVREADIVCHAGDFTQTSVYEDFAAVADRLEAVVGNRDSAELSDRLPAKRVMSYRGLSVVIVHGHRHTETALSALARQEEADLLITGHTHRPRVVVEDDYVLLNPGSHDQPRGARTAHATVRVVASDPVRIEGALVGDDGVAFEEFRVGSDGENGGG